MEKIPTTAAPMQLEAGMSRLGGEDGHEDVGPGGEGEGGNEVGPDEDEEALLLGDIVEMRHGDDAHLGRQRKLEHQHVLVEQLVHAPHHRHPDLCQDCVPYADDSRNHPPRYRGLAHT